MTVLTLRDTGVTDTHIQKNTPTTNFGSAQSFYVSASSSANIWRGLIKFAGLAPPGGFITVSSAVLTLKNRDAAASSRVMEVRRLLSTWEGLQATYNNRITGTPWNVAGVIGGTDVDATVIATGTMPTTSETNFDVSGAGFTQYVQDVMNGAITDYGVLLCVINDTTVFDGINRRLGASDNTTATNRPTLVVTYTTSTPPTVSTTDVSVTNLSGNATVTITLSAAALAGGVSGTVNTADITAIAGVDYTAQTGVPFSIPEGQSSGTIIVPILPG